MTTCYFTSGDWLSNSTHVCSGQFEALIVLSILPYWWRFWQCINKFFETGLWFPHLVNAGKYMTSVLVAAFAIWKELEGPYLIIWIFGSAVSTIYSFAWDITMDWGLLKTKEAGKKYLRPIILYPAHYYYIVAAINLFLRFGWSLTLLPTRYFNDWFNDGQFVLFVVSWAEVYRRAQWALFRVEWEHVNFRAKYKDLLELPKFKMD
jgi:hypothetical protein